MNWLLQKKKKSVFNHFTATSTTTTNEVKIYLIYNNSTK